MTEGPAIYYQFETPLFCALSEKMQIFAVPHRTVPFVLAHTLPPPYLTRINDICP